MPLPLIPAAIAGASGITTAALLADNDQVNEKNKQNRAKDRAVDKFYKDTFKNRYGPKGKELSNRDMSSETEEADMLDERAKQKALVADIANREAGLEAPSLRNKSQARSFSNQKTPQGMKKGGKVSSASSRADGCAQRGKTRGKMI